MCRVSVIMATYNCEKTLRESVDSILNQTFSDWEFVICDDASCDNSYKILEEYKEKYPEKFVILKNEKNMKLASSLNRCIEASKGEYIARMDGDDISFPERFEKEVAFLDSHPEFDCVGTAFIPFDENGEKTVNIKKREPDRYYIIFKVAAMHPTVMMRKTAYEKIGCYTTLKRCDRGQDHDMWFKFFAAGLRIYNLDEPLLYYREDINGMKKRTLKTRYYSTLTIFAGIKSLRLPFYYYILALKPLVLWLVPSKLMLLVHDWERKIFSRKNK